MEKPLNRFAIALWVIAAVFLLGDVPMTIGLKHVFAEARYPEGPSINSILSWMNIWAEVRSSLVAAVNFAAWGVIIELVDQIRWNAKNRK